MECTDLMLDDWVIDTYTGKHMRVPCVNINVGKGLEPIPLTPEILEKNGWSDWHEHSRIAKSCYELIDKQTSISFQTIDGQDSIFTQINHYGAGTYEFRKYLTYVHELQHALRLCGIDKEIML